MKRTEVLMGFTETLDELSTQALPYAWRLMEVAGERWYHDAQLFLDHDVPEVLAWPQLISVYAGGYRGCVANSDWHTATEIDHGRFWQPIMVRKISSRDYRCLCDLANDLAHFISEFHVGAGNLLLYIARRAFEDRPAAGEVQQYLFRILNVDS